MKIWLQEKHLSSQQDRSTILKISDIVDIVKTSNYTDELETEYGKYSRGLQTFYRRTLTPEQLDFILDSFAHTRNELQQLPSKAGQEYCVAITVGALDEK